jgi:hypothetical protein
MPLADVLGRCVPLHIVRVGPTAADLALHPGEQSALALPRRELPEALQAGDVVEAVVYLDGEERPAATTQPTRVLRDEVAFLMVTGETRFGVFVDWGPPKELLVPIDEQTRPLRVGERVPIGLLLDDTDRLIGTMKIRELLRTGGDFTRDEWVEGEAWREEPGLGLFVILERTRIGLLPAVEPHRLRAGDAARFRVARVHPDGKVELSLRGLAVDELEDDATRVLAVLSAPKRTGAPRYSDASSPEEIRARFGISKKAFKRAVGGLLKRGAVAFDDDGFLVVVRAVPTETSRDRK